jgi:hypothetical protein
MNSLDEYDIENEFQQNIHDINLQNNVMYIQNSILNKYKLNIYCVTQVLKTYVIEITKHLETMKKKT